MRADHVHRHSPLIRSSCAVALCVWLLVPTVIIGQERVSDERSALRAKADEIRASGENLFDLRRIPWVMDVAEGFRLAREERRPLFLYVITGDPLGDC
jgi:hypothetical protein